MKQRDSLFFQDVLLAGVVFAISFILINPEVAFLGFLITLTSFNTQTRISLLRDELRSHSKQEKD